MPSTSAVSGAIPRAACWHDAAGFRLARPHPSVSLHARETAKQHENGAFRGHAGGCAGKLLHGESASRPRQRAVCLLFCVLRMHLRQAAVIPSYGPLSARTATNRVRARKPSRPAPSREAFPSSECTCRVRAFATGPVPCDARAALATFVASTSISGFVGSLIRALRQRSSIRRASLVLSHCSIAPASAGLPLLDGGRRSAVGRRRTRKRGCRRAHAAT